MAGGLTEAQARQQRLAVWLCDLGTCRGSVAVCPRHCSREMGRKEGSGLSACQQVRQHNRNLDSRRCTQQAEKQQDLQGR